MIMLLISASRLWYNSNNKLLIEEKYNLILSRFLKKKIVKILDMCVYVLQIQWTLIFMISIFGKIKLLSKLFYSFNYTLQNLRFLYINYSILIELKSIYIYNFFSFC